jgi:pyruvate dehydrogenase E2 component (dihydrolipoamide acetyltransferase)
MPRLSDSMTEGTVVRWLVADGATVGAGEEIVEVETDKATMAYASDAAGVIRILVAEGTSVPVGEPIASVGEARSIAGTGSAGRVVASPVARRIARENGIELGSITGTGPGGRITRSDVEAAVAGGAAAGDRSGDGDGAMGGDESPGAEPVDPEPGEPRPTGTDTVLEPTRAQRLIAERMTLTKATVPEFTLQTEVEMERAIAVREQLKALGAATPSLNDLVVKAAALALRRHPRANASYLDGRFHLHERVNVGIAVAAPGLLLVPNIFDADVKTLGTIAIEARDLAGRAREGRLSPRELEGGTFTVSNLGMFGITAVAPILFADQAAILGVGATRELLRLRQGGMVAERVLTLTLTCDHRILYGADAAAFLAELRGLLEEPLALML